MAVSCADPWAPLRVDCSSVQQGAQQGPAWANAPDRRLARVWSPLIAALDDDPRRVVWMPAHCGKDQVGVRQLGNGDLLTISDVDGNAFADQLAKQAARTDRLPSAQRRAVREQGELIIAVATWIGQATRLANHFPDPSWSGSGKKPYLRDADGVACSRLKPVRHRKPREPLAAAPVAVQPQAPGLYDLSGHPRWDALRLRVQAKEAAAREARR